MKYWRGRRGQSRHASSSCLSCFLLNTFWFLSFNLHVLSIIHLFLDTCNSPKSPYFHPGHFMRTLIVNWHYINQTQCEMYSCIWSDFDSLPCLTFNFLNVYPSAFPSLSILFSISPLLPSYHSPFSCFSKSTLPSKQPLFLSVSFPAFKI